MSNFAYLETYNDAATIIQKTWKKKKVKIIKKKKDESENPKEDIRTDKFFIDLFCSELKKIKLTLDKFYRIWDVSVWRKITTKQFLCCIAEMRINFSEAAINRLLLILDEESKNEITYDDIVDVCNAYCIEFPPSLPENYVSVSKRALIKLAEAMNSRNIKSNKNFKIKEIKEISSDDFTNFVEKELNLKLLKRELHALQVLFGINKNKTIPQSDFIEILRKGQMLIQSSSGISKDLNTSVEDDNNIKNSRNASKLSMTTKANTKKKIINKEDNDHILIGKTQKIEMISHKIEKLSNIFLPMWFNFIKKSIIVTPQRVFSVLKKLYMRSNISQYELQELTTLIMNNKVEQKFKEFYNSILKITTYKWMKNNLEREFENLIDIEVKANPNFDDLIDKHFINLILAQSNRDYSKFDLLTLYYKNSEKYRKLSSAFLKKNAKSRNNLILDGVKKPVTYKQEKNNYKNIT